MKLRKSSVAKNLIARQETQVQSLGWEDPLETELATHSNILAWKIPWTEEPDRLQSMELQRARHDLETKHRHINSVHIILKADSVALC